MSTNRDLKIDSATGDLVLDGADLVIVADGAAIAQATRARLRLFRGEWFADLDAGVPWFTEVLVKNPNLVGIRATLRGTIADTVGVATIETFDLTFDSATRTLDLTFSLTTDAGELLRFDEKLSPTPEVT